MHVKVKIEMLVKCNGTRLTNRDFSEIYIKLKCIQIHYKTDFEKIEVGRFMLDTAVY